MAVRGIYPLWAEDRAQKARTRRWGFRQMVAPFLMDFGPIEKLIDSKRGIQISNLLMANLDRRTELGHENLISFLNTPLLV